MIVTASFGIEPGRRVEYIPLVEKALELSSHRPSKVLVYNRPNMVGGANAFERSLPLISSLFSLILPLLLNFYPEKSPL